MLAAFIVFVIALGDGDTVLAYSPSVRPQGRIGGQACALRMRRSTRGTFTQEIQLQVLLFRDSLPDDGYGGNVYSFGSDN